LPSVGTLAVWTVVGVVEWTFCPVSVPWLYGLLQG